MSNKSKAYNPPKAARLAITSQVSYTGLFPHPDILEGFKRIDPELVNRVIELSERSINKLQDLQAEESDRFNKKLDADIRQRDKALKDEASYDFRGQLLVFILVVLILGVALLAAFSGFEKMGIAIVSGGFVVIVTSAIKGFTNKKEKQNLRRE